VGNWGKVRETYSDQALLRVITRESGDAGWMGKQRNTGTGRKGQLARLPAVMTILAKNPSNLWPVFEIAKGSCEGGGMGQAWSREKATVGRISGEGRGTKYLRKQHRPRRMSTAYSFLKTGGKRGQMGRMVEWK